MPLKISLLVPTCRREQLFAGFIQSVNQMTENKSCLELLVIADEQDTISQKYAKTVLSNFPNIESRLLIRPYSRYLNEDYYNWAARQATGDLFWVLADDLEICSPNWDTVIQREVESFSKKYPDKIFCVSIRDNTPPPSHRLPKFPCFPMLTREAQKAFGGWILHPKVPTWGADYVTYCIFQPLDRLLVIHDKNYINHISWHNKQVQPDPTNIRIGETFNQLKMVPHHNTDRIIAEEVPNIRLDLKEQIANFHGKTAKEMF